MGLKMKMNSALPCIKYNHGYGEPAIIIMSESFVIFSVIMMLSQEEMF